MKYLDEAGLSGFAKQLLGYIPKKCIDSRTYQNIIATANSQAAGTFYFAKITPDDYYQPCRVKVRYLAKINDAMTHADRAKYRGLYEVEVVICGESATRYENHNAIYSASYKPIYYHSLYRASKAGQDKGCPHYLGTALYSANAPTTATLKRDFIVELIETENCTVEMLDEMVLQSAFYNSTDYIGISNYNAYSNGCFHTGDANSIDRLCYGSFQPKAADVSLYGTQLILSADGENFHSITNQRSNSLTLATKKVNQYPFRPRHIFYYSNSTTVAAGSRTTTSAIYESLPFDFLYCYKGSAMTAHKPVYLVSTYDAETDTYTPVEDTWITQTLPTTEDGLYYVLLGYAYTASSIYLKPEHPVFKYEGGQIKEVKDESLESRVAAVENSDGLKVVAWLDENNLSIGHDDTTSTRYMAVVNDGTMDGAYFPTFYWMQDQMAVFDSVIPQKTSQLTNDSDFVTQTDMSTAMGQALTQVQTIVAGATENKADKTEIPSLDSYATKDYVQKYVAENQSERTTYHNLFDVATVHLNQAWKQGTLASSNGIVATEKIAVKISTDTSSPTILRIHGYTPWSWNDVLENVHYWGSDGSYLWYAPVRTGKEGVNYGKDENGDFYLYLGWTSDTAVSAAAGNYKYVTLSFQIGNYSKITENDVKDLIITIDEPITASEGDSSLSSPLNGKKVLVLGDSISTDTYGSYKKWVTDLVDDGFMPNSVTNNSYHATGFLATYSESGKVLYDTFYNRLSKISNKDTYDLVIVFGGINDYIQAKPLADFKTAVDTFFEYLTTQFVNARILVLLPLRTYNIYKNTAGFYQTEYAEYIRTVAKSWCLPVLNLTEESGFYPFKDEFKAKWTLIPSGYTSPDGVHPNAEYSKNFLAPMIKNFIKKYY